jgi:tetratricopeptide (TPR) repeat protein
LLVLGLGIAYGGRQLWARYHFHAAQEAVKQLDFDQAQKHLDLCLKIWPDDTDTLFLAAQSARRRGAPEEADRYLSACEDLQGVTPSTALERSLQRAQEGDLSDVSGPLQALIQNNDPHTPLILEALTQGYLNTLHLTEAQQTVGVLLQRQPEHYRALLWRGRIWEYRNEYEEALKNYQQAVDLHPEFDQARMLLANMLARVGRVREAVGQYECLLRRQPGNVEVILGLARCRHDLHDLEQAKQLLDALLAEQPQLVRALTERGRLALRMGPPEEAEPWLRRAVAAAPHDRDAQFLLHLCLDMQGKTSEANQALARYHEIETDTTRAAALMNQVMSAPHDASLRFEIGTILLRNGDDEQGLRWLFSALQEDPKHAPTHAALAAYYRRTGQAERAEKFLH